MERLIKKVYGKQSEVYVKKGKKDFVLKLKKALYALKHHWFGKLS